MDDVKDMARVLIISEDPFFHINTGYILQKEPGLEISGEFSSAEEAADKIEALCPNVILMDSATGGTESIEACRQFTENGFDGDVIIFGTEQDNIDAALKAGAAGYFPRGLEQKDILDVVKMACRWQTLKTSSDNGQFTIRQIESMIIDNLAKHREYEEIPGAGVKADPAEDSPNRIRELSLFISIPHTALQLMNFCCRLQEDMEAGILETLGSSRGTRIAISLATPDSPENIIKKISGMAEVETAIEKSPVKKRAGFFGQSRAVRNELFITLSELTPAPDFSVQPARPQIEAPDFSRRMTGIQAR